MSPREVKSLNELAMAHGGQLSINPQTGLPEAGFLESILPMVAGAALTATGVGAPMAALMVGGGMTLMTGSLEKGLMAGLGAYGGANLGAGLMETGVTMDPTVIDAKKAVIDNAVANQAYNPANTSLTPEAWSAAEGATKKTLADTLNTARATAAGPDTFMGKLQAMGKGVGYLGQEGGLSSLYQNLGGSPMSLISKIGPAVAPLAGELMKPEKQEEEKADADMGQRYGFSMNPTGGQRPQQVQPGQDPMANTQSPTTTPFPTPDIYGREQRYFAPSYTKLTPEAAKKLYGYADGGVATDPDRPTETPALQAFKQMQAQRAAQPPVPQIDANAQFNQYAQQTVGAPNQLQAPTAPAPTTTGLADSGYSYDPVKQQYSQIAGATPAEGEAGAEADAFTENWRPGVPYSNVDPKTGKWTNYDRYGQKMNANGGLMAAYAGGGMPTTPSSIGANAHYPQAHTLTNRFSAPTQMPINEDVVSKGGARIDLHTGEERLAAGGISHLGDYSDGGRLLRGPGDGVSDSIPAMIGKRQPARLADGEFVVPARIVSELGNGSTEAGARKLYAMMDRIQKARRKTVGKGKVAKNSRSEKYLPA
jgi:hypothetical protein